MSSSWIYPLTVTWCPFSSLVIFFILRSILSDMRIASPAFFCFPFAWNVFFSSAHARSICVFRSEVGFLYTAYIFPGPLLIRTRCPDTSPNSSLRMKSTGRGSFSVHRSEKTPGSKYSSTSGLSPRGHLERQAEFHASTQDEA